MLSHDPFYWEHLKKYVVLMGTLINDISIIRQGKNGDTKTIKIPVSFSQKDKSLNRLMSDPELRRSWKATIPRLGFEMGTPTYAPERKDNTNNLYTLNIEGKKRSMQFPPVPYDIPFTVYLWVPYYEDGLQVVEQILPFFQPGYAVCVKENPQLGFHRDVMVDLLSVEQSDSFDGEFDQARIIEWQFQFNMQGWLYGPVQKKNVIKESLVNIMFNVDENTIGNENAPHVEYKAIVDPIEADRDDPHSVIESFTEKF